MKKQFRVPKSISFSEATKFILWLMTVDNMGRQTRYLHNEQAGYFFDDDRNIYSVKDMYIIFKKERNDKEIDRKPSPN